MRNMDQATYWLNDHVTLVHFLPWAIIGKLLTSATQSEVRADYKDPVEV